MSEQRYPTICTMELGFIEVLYGLHEQSESIYLRIQCAARDPQGCFDEIKAAHAAAKAAYPDLDPASYCTAIRVDRGQSSIPSRIAERWAELGISIRSADDDVLDTADMAMLCAAFLNLGNPALQAEVTHNPIMCVQAIFGEVGSGLFTI